MDEINEKHIEKLPRPITINSTECILKQMKNFICRIDLDEKNHGSGFFCKIQFSKNEVLPVLITCNHIIDDDFLSNNQFLKIFIYQKHINLSLEKIKYYTDKQYDITILEVKSNEINNFLELDNDLAIKSNIKEFNDSIYIIHYPSSSFNENVVSYGTINITKDKIKFEHFCSTEDGSSGSPILDITNNKVIGIHTGASTSFKINYGSFLNESINNFINENYSNEMIIQYKLNGEKNIAIFGSSFVDKYRNNCRIIIEKSEQEIIDIIDVKELKKKRFLNNKTNI